MAFGGARTFQIGFVTLRVSWNCSEHHAITVSNRLWAPVCRSGETAGSRTSRQHDSTHLVFGDQCFAVAGCLGTGDFGLNASDSKRKVWWAGVLRGNRFSHNRGLFD